MAEGRKLLVNGECGKILGRGVFETHLEVVRGNGALNEVGKGVKLELSVDDVEGRLSSGFAEGDISEAVAEGGREAKPSSVEAIVEAQVAWILRVNMGDDGEEEQEAGAEGGTGCEGRHGSGGSGEEGGCGWGDQSGLNPQPRGPFCAFLAH